MKSLKEHYKQVCEDGAHLYYSTEARMQIAAEWPSPLESPRKFIEGYFKRGGKHSLVPSCIFDEIPDNRYEHTVSLFLMGIVLYKNCSAIRNPIRRFAREVEKEIPQECHDNCPCRAFLYLWYLTCLFHDVGYAYEEKKLSSAPPPQLPCWGKLCNKRVTLDIKAGPWVPGDLKGDTLTKYMKMGSENGERFRGRKCIDHGIAGGYLLLKLISDEPLIHRKDHPLLFLLCLADTIEPVKTAGKKCLESVKLAIQDEKLTFHKHPKGSPDLKFLGVPQN